MSADVRRFRLDHDDQAEHRYYEVPFELTGATSFEVVLDFDASRGVLDLGCLAPNGWRGWSGGARRRFAIASGAATPGYVPGELEDGRWAVVLGLHVLPADGLDVEVTINVPATAPPDVEPPSPPVPVEDIARGSARRLPAPDGLTWYAGDMHAHSVHSDGSRSIGWLAAEAVASGLDFLAVTDHNTISHHRHLPGIGDRYGIGLIPGQEVTTARGHANAYGDIGWIDFRRPASEWVDEVERRGGLLSINHAIDGDCAWQHPLPVHPRLLEVWHTSWFRDLKQTGIYGFWQAWGTTAIPIGGSDFHKPERAGRDRIGAPTTWVAATDPSPEAILAGIAAGRTSLSVGPHEPVLLHVGDELIALEAAGTILVDVDGRRRTVNGDRVTLAAEARPGGAGTGPYHLETPAREVVAISA